MSAQYDEASGEVVFEGASPDEEATLIGVYCCGFELLPKGVNRDLTEWKNHHSGQTHSGLIRGVNDFSSDRKRMSVIVQHSPSGAAGSTRYTLYCKGADSVILELCKATEDNETVKATAVEHAKKFAEQGLRTLVLAKKELGPDEAEIFLQELESARTSVFDRDERLEKAAAKMETDLELMGVTAIEDKIQEGVPETLRDLLDGGIKVWMLTGDKTETV
jgi:magnesium-transporting ATPase (P-type)